MLNFVSEKLNKSIGQMLRRGSCMGATWLVIYVTHLLGLSMTFVGCDDFC